MNRNVSASIQHQLQRYFMLPLVITVLVMGGAWVAYNQLLLAREAERVLVAEADIVGAAARPAMMFSDGRLAGELLQNMHFDSDISAVKLFTYDGEPLYTYRFAGDSGDGVESIAFHKSQSTRYVNGRLHLYRVVTHKEKPVGVIYLESRLNHLKENRNAGILAVVMTMFGCLVLGFVLAFRLQKKIAGPISSLAQLMRQMGRDRDYTLRAEGPAFNRETDELLVGFNDMAAEVQSSFRKIEESNNQLQQSEQRFRNIVEMAPVSVIVTHLTDGHVLFYNQTAAKLFGVDINNESQFNVLDFYQLPEQRQGLMEKLKQQGELHGQELEVVKADGTSFWISLSASVMRFEGEEALFAAFVDITEQKSVEQLLAKNNQALEQRVVRRTAELQTAKNGLQSTLDNMIDTYYRIDADGTVQWASASVLSLLGYHASEIAGLPARSLSVDGQAFVQLAETLSRSDGVVIHHKIQLRHKAGHTIWGSLSARQTTDARGKVVGLEGVVRDITRLVKDEEQKQVMEEKMAHVQRLESLGILAGGIAHDFNNILAGIMGNAELAEMNISDGLPIRRELKNIVSGSTRAADLCKQMLAYSGQGICLKSDVNMTVLVEEELQLIDVSVPKNISLTLDLANALPAVHADKTQMQQIIMNLVTNAAESIGDAKAGGITITTAAIQAGNKELESRFIEEVREPGNYVFIEVSDDGSGMDAATKAKLFDPFFTTKFTGRGLGMSAVLGIVRSHGGTLQVNSKPGQGTRFTVLLPASDIGDPIPVKSIDEPVKETHIACTVLVIDDELMVRTVVERLLKKLDCKVLLAANGREGVETYREHAQQIDVVLLDLTMPVMDGKEALGLLHGLNASLPVFICSGYSHESVAVMFDADKPCGFLQKPFTLHTLSEMLQKVIIAR